MWAAWGPSGEAEAQAGSPGPVSGDAVEKVVTTDPDRLWLHQGDPITGHFENETLELQTPYGRVRVRTEQVSEVRLASGPHQIDNVVMINGDRFSGMLLDPVFRMRPRLGPSIALRRDLATRLVLGRAAAASVLPASGWILLLRNGDRVSGRLPDDPIRLVTPSLDVKVALEEVLSISFDQGQPLLVSVRLADSPDVEGLWPDREIEVMTDVGWTLRVHPTRLVAIQHPVRLGRGAPIALQTPAADAARAGEARPGMVWIAPGELVMGSPVDELDRDWDEGPQTRVRITRGFWMGMHEITQGEYEAVMGENPSRFLGDARRPVERVRHRDAVEYGARLTRLQAASGVLPTGYAYRLPTEAEWEYACRAGTITRFSHGDDLQGHALEDYAWFSANSRSSTHPVGTRLPNPWGLYDLHGNVLEWCLDGAGGELPGGEVADYQVPPAGLLRIARGGSWLYGARACRSANRDSYGESTRSSDLGFRVVLAPIER